MTGMSLNGGMGISPLTWSEIDAFCNRSTFDLCEWQIEAVILMSRAYCSWIHKGKEPFCASPWENMEHVRSEDYQSSLESRAKSLFRAS